MKRIALLLLLLCACRAEPDPAAHAPDNRAAAKAAPQSQPSRGQIEDARAAAAALRLYYEHLGRGDYRAAWRMRDEPPDFAAFERNFAAYEDYRATVGVPTVPVEDRGYVWVEVPVQLYGRWRGGAPFGSVGRVTLKRRAGSGEWRIAA